MSCYRFKINNETWEIKELTQKEILEHKKKRQEYGYNEEINEGGRYFGSTYIDEQIIVIDKDLPFERKRKTLIHEIEGIYMTITQIYRKEKGKPFRLSFL